MRRKSLFTPHEMNLVNSLRLPARGGSETSGCAPRLARGWQQPSGRRYSSPEPYPISYIPMSVFRIGLHIERRRKGNVRSVLSAIPQNSELQIRTHPPSVRKIVEEEFWHESMSTKYGYLKQNQQWSPECLLKTAKINIKTGYSRHARAIPCPSGRRRAWRRIDNRHAGRLHGREHARRQIQPCCRGGGVVRRGKGCRRRHCGGGSPALRKKPESRTGIILSRTIPVS